MGNEGSQDLLSGSVTPDSDASSAMPLDRRTSASSLAEPPEVDMSHLSEEERAQISAVMARAKHVQQEETARVRVLEDEYSEMAACVMRRASMVDMEPLDEDLCPICSNTELTGDNLNVCSDCEAFACLDCGAYETNLSTQLQEWLCVLCQKRRHLLMSSGMWYYGQHAIEEQNCLPELLPSDQCYVPQQGDQLTQQLSTTSSKLQHSTGQNSSAEPTHAGSEWTDKTNMLQEPHVELSSTEKSPALEKTSDVDTAIGFMASEAKIRTNIAYSISAEQLPETATDKYDGVELSTSAVRCEIPSEEDKRNINLYGSIPQGQQRSHQLSSKEDESKIVTINGGSVLTGNIPDRLREQSTSDITMTKSYGASVLHEEPERHVSVDTSIEPRLSGMSIAETSSSQAKHMPQQEQQQQQTTDAGNPSLQKTEHDANSLTENGVSSSPRKIKPSALERIPMNNVEPEKNHSPTRKSPRSPRSPPRSPSWMRYRESPRSSPIRGLSPPVSPNDRYTATMSDNTQSIDDRHGDEFFVYADHTSFEQNDGQVGSASDRHSLVFDKGPPKPARVLSGGQFEFAEDAGEHIIPPIGSLDLAAYAAAVASDTDNLTSMSISPTNVADHDDAESDNVSPRSPNYSSDSSDSASEISQKTIDHQNNKRQKVRPPPTDWSPVTDLSPILDVSPTVEAIEQQQMIAEQRRHASEMNQLYSPESTCTPSPCDSNQDDCYDSNNKDDSGSHIITSSLKRYEHFDDISKLASDLEQEHTKADQTLSNVETETIAHSIKPAQEICKEVQAEKAKQWRDGDMQCVHVLTLSPTSTTSPNSQSQDKNNRKTRRVLPEPMPENITPSTTSPVSNTKENVVIVTTAGSKLTTQSVASTVPLPDDANKDITGQYTKPEKNAPPPELKTTQSSVSGPSAHRTNSPVKSDDAKIRRKLPPLPPVVSQSPAPTSAGKTGTMGNVQTQEKNVLTEKEILRLKLQKKYIAQESSGVCGASNSTKIASVSPRESVVTSGDAGGEKPVRQSDIVQMKTPQVSHDAKQSPPLPATTTTPRKSKRPSETTSMCGIQIPLEIKFLKQRLKEEIQMATASRRLKIDEMEEVRLMERELAEREKARKLKIAAEKEAVEMKKRRRKEEQQESSLQHPERPHSIKQRCSQQKHNVVHTSCQTDTILIGSPSKKPGAPPSQSTLASKAVSPQVNAVASAKNSSPQMSPRRSAKHKRQPSDPMVAKFSPIEEDRDFENGLLHEVGCQTKGYTVDEISPVYSEVTRKPRLLTPPDKSNTGQTPKRLGATLSKSSEVLSKYAYKDKGSSSMISSQSESSLPMSPPSRRGASDGERLTKEHKKNQLQLEIEKRKRQLEETMLLRSGGRHDVNKHDVSSYVMTSSEENRGIIMPIDYEAAERRQYAAYSDLLDRMEENQTPANYSSSEYLAHKNECQQADSPESAGFLPDDAYADTAKYQRSQRTDSSPETTGEGTYLAGRQDSDPLNTMYRAASDQSLADSDDNIMEGGVTIRQQLEKKKTLVPTAQRAYDFPTKRILLTRDPKDRTVKGNRMGMRIVGGKTIRDGGDTVGAFVTTIYPGGIADQLHGELQEGDQVLEWNGVELTGKTYEQVQRIISHTNGEIELIIRPNVTVSNQKMSSLPTMRSESCHSSYDNLESPSDETEYDSFTNTQQGVDPDLLAAQLEDMKSHMSPGVSPSSSQADVYLTPSMSTSASSDQTDYPTPVIESPPENVKLSAGRLEDMGEIQMQLSFDTYDGTLNVHVIQARNLQSKDKNGFSDPYVKVYLLPGRSSENKRRTKRIARSLDPEWHQTLVFMNIPWSELRLKKLEITVWDYDRFKPNDFLGELVLDLADDTFLDNKPHWYRLQEHVEISNANVKKHKSKTCSPPPRCRPAQPGTNSKTHAPIPQESSSVCARRRAQSRASGDAQTHSQPEQTNNASPLHSDRGPVHYSLGLGRRKVDVKNGETNVNK